jgi:hypothetical protein
VLDCGNVFFLDADLVRSAVNHCPHSASRHSESPCRRFGVPTEALLTHRAANFSTSVTKASQPVETPEQATRQLIRPYVDRSLAVPKAISGV